MHKNVFLSYSLTDAKELADAIKNSLESSEFTIQVDEEMLAGSPIADQIAEQITNSSVIVVLLTASAKDSKWLPQEVGVALRNENSIVLPVLLDRSAKDSPIFSLIADRQYLDAENLGAEEVADKILQAIKGIAGEKTTHELPVNPDPTDIVKCCRNAYREFMNATQQIAAGKALTVSTFSNGEGIRDGKIVVSVDAPDHEDVWATNVIANPNNKLIGFIFINSDLLGESEAVRKFVLAHEWIEVMLAFAWKGTSPYHQTLSQNHKLDMTMMFSAIKKRALWQDSPDELLLMNAALRRLLVSKESLENMIRHNEPVFSPVKDLATWAELCASNPAAARNLIKLMCLIFSHTKQVTPETVEERIQEILFDGLQE